MAEEEKISALIDPKGKQVACVIIQAAYGGDRRVVHEFNNWLTFPNDDLVMVSGTMKQWRDLAKEWNKPKDAVQR